MNVSDPDAIRCARWQKFAASGSVYDYLDYLNVKSQQSSAGGNDAIHNNGTGAADGPGGGGRPDSDHFFTG